ncbi:Protein of unknown function [Gryllus bimaculatus]|nr:Protein of unknown function [Gryllus bimaculatus]
MPSVTCRHGLTRNKRTTLTDRVVWRGYSPRMYIMHEAAHAELPEVGDEVADHVGADERRYATVAVRDPPEHQPADHGAAEEERLRHRRQHVVLAHPLVLRTHRPTRSEGRAHAHTSAGAALVWTGLDWTGLDGARLDAVRLDGTGMNEVALN